MNEPRNDQTLKLPSSLLGSRHDKKPTDRRGHSLYQSFASQPKLAL